MLECSKLIQIISMSLYINSNTGKLDVVNRNHTFTKDMELRLLKLNESGLKPIKIFDDYRILLSDNTIYNLENDAIFNIAVYLSTLNIDIDLINIIQINGHAILFTYAHSYYYYKRGVNEQLYEIEEVGTASTPILNKLKHMLAYVDRSNGKLFFCVPVGNIKYECDTGVDAIFSVGGSYDTKYWSYYQKQNKIMCCTVEISSGNIIKSTSYESYNCNIIVNRNTQLPHYTYYTSSKCNHTLIDSDNKLFTLEIFYKSTNATVQQRNYKNYKFKDLRIDTLRYHIIYLQTVDNEIIKFDADTNKFTEILTNCTFSVSANKTKRAIC
jgi:hypothetical protein